ncbi:ATP-binding protein [Litoribrevibacter euphylliae]|uniref:histidine kinase n=1 Tax=Litoribrevibacter euphylliae TaxID=1834034 RepID=A0ABV7H7T7_9GAMM
MPSPPKRTFFQTVFSPARSLMDRLSYLKKFMLISALFLLPVGLLGYGLVTEIQRNLAITKVEQQGLRMLAQAFKLIEQASEFRDRSIILRVNDLEVIRNELDTKKKQVESMLNKLKMLVDEFDDAEIDHQLKQVHVSWKQLNSYSSGAQGGPHIQFKYYDSFVRTIQVLVDVIGYRTKLVHDPNLNTFLLINMLSDDMPIALRELGRARAYGAYALNQLSIDHDTYKELDEIYDDLTDSFHLLSNNLGYAVAENKQFHLPLQRGVDRVITGVLKGRDSMYREIIEADQRTMGWQDYYLQMTDIHNTMYQFIDTLLDIVEEQLKNRADEESGKLIGFMCLTAFLLALIIFLYAGMYLSVHQTLKSFVEKSKSVANGRLDTYMPESTRDEMRELALNFNQMVSQLSKNQQDLVEARKMASMGQLVAGVAHEMNTPLGIALTSVSFLEEQMAKVNQNYSEGRLSTADFQNMIFASTESLGLIVKNLNKASSLVSTFKMLSVKPEPDLWASVELKAFLGKLSENLSLSTELKAKCKVKCVDEVEAFQDVEKLATLLEILINNAFQHGYGGDALGDVIISAESYEDRIRLAVEDSGKGIDDSMINQIFDPFVTSSRMSGTAGLGLHIAYNIVTQALYGHIKCMSEPGKYTRFEIEIPKDLREQL